MITLFSGTPGSGKSLSMAQDIIKNLKLGKNVISNVPINVSSLRSCKGKYFFIKNNEISPKFFIEFSQKYHKTFKESQTVVYIDEAQVIFSPSSVKLHTQQNKFWRQNWLEFFSQHRHFCFDFVFVTQFDKLIDAQIRYLFEYNYIHRKANNFGFGGKLLDILHIPLFVQVQYWYGSRQLCGRRFFIYRKKFSKIYDTFYMDT